MTCQIRAVMLLTSDLDRAVRFYESGLGLKKGRGGADMATFEMEGSALAIVTRDSAERLTGLILGEAPEIPSQFLVLQAGSREEVGQIIDRAHEAGARVLRRPADNDWGGYSAAFSDPDGHTWSVGFNLEFYRA